MARWLLAVPALGVVAAVATSFAPACSLGTGSGSVTGVLDAQDCWSGPFNLQPDFFAAVPYRQSLELRIQNGGDYETFSDGVQILIDDTGPIRNGLFGVPLEVSLPVGVVPPGVPLTPNPNPASVHLALYMTKSCRTQNPALYAMEAVTLNAAGGCDARDGGNAFIGCAGGSRTGVADAGPDASSVISAGDAAAAASTDGAAGAVGHSTITFTKLFNGDVTESSASARQNTGTFHVYLADPREICPGGLGPPPPCRGELFGQFDFYFERGRPAQPFP